MFQPHTHTPRHTHTSVLLNFIPLQGWNRFSSPLSGRLQSVSNSQTWNRHLSWNAYNSCPTVKLKFIFAVKISANVHTTPENTIVAQNLFFFQFLASSVRISLTLDENLRRNCQSWPFFNFHIVHNNTTNTEIPYNGNLLVTGVNGNSRFPWLPGIQASNFPSLPVAFCNFPSRSREKEVLAGN